MVEVFVLVEPLDSEVVLAVVLQTGVDWVDVLHSALAGDELMCSLISWLVLESQAKWEPSLLNLWVHLSGGTKVLVYSSQDLEGHNWLVVKEGLVEDGLEVDIEELVLVHV